MKALKPVGGLAKSTIILFCIYLFTVACLMLTYIYQLIEFAPLDGAQPLENLLPSQAISGLVSLGFLLVYLITAILFLKWTYRLSKNLHVRLGGNWDHSAGGAVGWYFVPIAGLFKPYQAMREIYTKAHKTQFVQSRILPGWWVLWILATLFGQVTSHHDTITVNEYRLDAVLYLVLYLLMIALTLTAIALVSQTTRAYTENFEQPEEPQTSPAESDYQQNLQTPASDPA